ncbi:hypothetical protein FOQG_11927 [Fusarium oxysporum f. sp. raphani 54005]|uniref:Heterokaryon incompatibility domain-containing protein n=1 Tax=Fusarium oxysporum f. sp. raphani 54005 TaxID=1089458 RepID=X0BPJ6_FUSOX|nr:hypothetical protein FOQG_11927 [Fusarium oxysporum f. sp. raphani 54005]
MSSKGDTSSELSVSTDGNIEHEVNQILFPVQQPATWTLLAEWHLCLECKSLLKWQDDYESLQLQSAKIRKSKDDGCQFCNVLCEAAAWAKLWVEDENHQSQDTCEEDVWIETLSRNIIRLVSLKDVEPEIGCLISIDVDYTSDLPHYAIPGCSLSSESLSFIRTQLENCVSNPSHVCQPSQTIDRTRWPARVLELDDNSVVLVDFNSDVMPGNFAALSYCWGSPAELQLKPPYKAIASTVQDLRSGISTAKLPLTIQQALLVCNWLNIHYIWIDSLCILQDSTQDWAIEATKMETVYSMSKVTIIAASSTSCHSGFLDINLHSFQLCKSLNPPFQLTASPLCTSGFHKLKYEGHPYDYLDTRGWTFQEEFLSSRYLKFTNNDIQWKCSAGSTCMCGQPASEDYAGLWGEEHPTIVDQRRWESLVEEFSHRRFTKDTDKLVAISSLSKKLAPEFPTTRGQSQYVAGLWRSELVQQLNCPEFFLGIPQS